MYYNVCTACYYGICVSILSVHMIYRIITIGIKLFKLLYSGALTCKNTYLDKDHYNNIATVYTHNKCIISWILRNTLIIYTLS